MTGSGWGARIRDAIAAACHPDEVLGSSVGDDGSQSARSRRGTGPTRSRSRSGAAGRATTAAGDRRRPPRRAAVRAGGSVARPAGADLRGRPQRGRGPRAGGVHPPGPLGAPHQDEAKAAPYLRSIVLNLARDNNRRGLVSLRHHLPVDDHRASTEDEIELQEDQQQVIDALRELPHPPTQRARAALLRGAGDRRHRRRDGHLPQLGQDASQARARGARGAAGRSAAPTPWRR